MEDLSERSDFGCTGKSVGVERRSCGFKEKWQNSRDILWEKHQV
jgi:hypothetical protein